MKETTKNFLEETFKEIQDSLNNGDYEDAACSYSVEDGVIEIAIGRCVIDSIEDEVNSILEKKLLSLFDDVFDGEIDKYDYFDIEIDDDCLIDVGQKVRCLMNVYFLTVETNIEKLEELFNEN